MSTPIRLHQNEKGMKLVFVCRDESGSPIDVTGFSIDFLLYDGETLLNGGDTLCVKSNAVLGEVEYTVRAEDTQRRGLLDGKVRLSNEKLVLHNLGIIPIDVRGISG